MKGVAPHDRPREKLERLGPTGLGDNELMAVVLGGGGARTQCARFGQSPDRACRWPSWVYASERQCP